MPRSTQSLTAATVTKALRDGFLVIDGKRRTKVPDGRSLYLVIQGARCRTVERPIP